MKAGPRSRLIIIQRFDVTGVDDYGQPERAWVEYCRAWASVSFGTAQERREAAQTQASMTATFSVLANPMTSAASVQDRISFDGGFWDITSNVQSREFNAGRDISALRAVS